MLTWTCQCGHVVQSRRLVYPIHCFCGRTGFADGTIVEPSIPPTIRPSSASSRWRGMGDVIAWLMKLVGIKACKSCERRKKRINKLIPFPPFWQRESKTDVARG